MILATWVSQWIRIRSAGLAPRTVESYLDLTARYISLIHADIETVSADAISGLLSSICSAGKTRTAQLVYILLRASLADAAKIGRITQNPMNLVLRPRHYQQSRDYLLEGELSRLVQWCVSNPSPETRAWLLAALLGLRRGEICGLRWSDVDFTHKLVHIRNQRQRISGKGIIDSPPKSHAGLRDIPLPDLLLQILRSVRGLGYVVPILPDQLDRLLKPTLVALDLPPITLHGLRHSMASLALQKGTNLRVLQSILGHSSPTTTAAIYCHVQINDQRIALDALTAVCYNSRAGENT